MENKLTTSEEAFARLADLTTTIDWSPQQQADFDTWFAGSMIHHGTPQVLFRGTAASSGLFPQADGWYGRGIYLTDSSELAEEYAFDSHDREGGVPQILSAFIRMEHPYIFTERNNDSASNVQLMQALGFSISEISASVVADNSPELIRGALQAAGHDGLVVHDSEGVEYVVFDETQILELPRKHQAVVDALDLEAKRSARGLGFDVVRAADASQTQPHIGPIVGATGAYLIQSTGRACAVIHDKHKFVTTPEIGTIAEVRYEAGMAVVATPERARDKSGIGR